MIFDIEYLCMDYRPLCRRNSRLVDFMKPLHLSDDEMSGQVCTRPTGFARCVESLMRYLRTRKKKRNPDADADYTPFYRHIGLMNNPDSPDRAYFKAHTSLRFPDFHDHELKFKSDKKPPYALMHTGRIRRYFTVGDFGVVNRLHLGLNFDVEIPEGSTDIRNKLDVQQLIDRVMEVNVAAKTYVGINKKIDKKTPREEALLLWQLGKWLPKVVSHSTKRRFWPKKVVCDRDVKTIGATAVILYGPDELPDELPRSFRKFKAAFTGWPGADIRYYDYRKRGNKPIRVYMVRYAAGTSAHTLHKLKGHLFDLRSSFQALEVLARFERVFTASVWQNFAAKQIDRIKTIRADDQTGGIDLRERDCGEVLSADRRRRIAGHISLFQSNPVNV